MKDALQIVSLLFTPLIAVIAVYIAVQQHAVQRDKLRLDLYEKRLAVFDATMALLATVHSEAVASREAIYHFITGTANTKFLFGPDIESYLNTLASKVMVHRALYDKMDRDQKAEKADAETIKKETESLKGLIAEHERARELFQPYLGFAVRASGDSDNYERVFFRFMLLVVVLSVLGFGGASLAAWQQSRTAHRTGSTYYDILRKREAVCDSVPASYLCDPEQIKAYRKGMNEAFDAWSDLRSQGSWFLMLAWAVPLGCVIAFYAGRWVVTDKIRPLRPSRKA